MSYESRANELVGKSISTYPCNKVANYAIYGNANVNHLAGDYL